MDKSQQQTVAGEIVEIDETYTRDAPVGVPVLAWPPGTDLQTALAPLRRRR